MDKTALNRAVLRAVLILGAAACLAAGGRSYAQERRSVSFTSPAKHTTYTQQCAIDVGDLPGHNIRIYDIRRTYPEDPPAFDGVRLKEVLRRGYSDYVDVNGRAWGYDIYVLEGGDKVFLQWSGTSIALAEADKAGKSRFVGILRITGGTGRFLGIRGMLKETVEFSPQSGLNEAYTQGEYWMEK